MGAADNGISRPFGLTRSPARSGMICLSVSGEIDISTVGQLRDAIDLVLEEPGVGRILLDFEPLRFLDSSGIAALVGAYRAAEERGIRLGVRGCSGTVRHILEVTGVYQVLVVDENP
jgi:anti-sigma B factor antagonist